MTQLFVAQVDSGFGLLLFDVFDASGDQVARDLTSNQVTHLAAQRGAELRPKPSWVAATDAAPSKAPRR